MKIPLIVLVLIFSISGFSQENENQNKKTLLGLKAGLNYSLLSSDQYDVQSGARPRIGIFMQQQISENFSIEASLAYSNKGSQSTSPYYKISNQYIEPELKLGYELFDGFQIHSGINYAHLLTERMIILSEDGTPPTEKSPIDAFDSEFSIPIGLDQRLFENVRLSVDFYIPLNNPGTKNLSVTLRIPLNTKPEKISYRKMKVRASRKQIMELKEGVLCVRLKTSANTIAALRKAGRTEEASRRVEAQYTENQKIMQAFRRQFDFCRVEFFYSDKSAQFAQGELENIFLDNKLQIDTSISIGAGTNLFTAEFGNLKPDTMQYFSGYSQDLNENAVPVQFANHYSVSSNIDFDALVIMDRNFVQLNRPFPYYSRYIFKSMKQQPEQGLFIFPLLPYLSWSYDECVKKLNQKLNHYYEKTYEE